MDAFRGIASMGVGMYRGMGRQAGRAGAFVGSHRALTAGAVGLGAAGVGYGKYRSSGRDGLRGRSSGGY